MKLRRTKLGEDHPDTLRLIHNLAIYYSQAGRRAEALQLAEQVVELHRTNLGEDHPDALKLMELLSHITEQNSGNSKNGTGDRRSQHPLSRLWQLIHSRGS